MILLKITNASELVASKVGKFIERLTPDKIDLSTVESEVIKELIKTLTSEGLKGEVSSVDGIEVENDHLIIKKDLKIRNQKDF